jgi:hypothetical protein
MEEKTEPKIEKKTNKKKVFTIVGVVAGVIVIAAAAFIGGRFLNQRASLGGGLMQVGGAAGGGNVVSMSVEIIPAPELPTTAPDVTGLLAERKDNSIFIQTFSMDTTGGGTGVVVSSSSASSTNGVVTSGSSNNNGPKVEVVVTNDTKIYKDVTSMTLNPGDGPTKIQQVMEPGSLDDITSQTMITVWGRKVGDRVIADIIAFTNPITFTTP